MPAEIRDYVALLVEYMDASNFPPTARGSQWEAKAETLDVDQRREVSRIVGAICCALERERRA